MQANLHTVYQRRRDTQNAANFAQVYKKNSKCVKKREKF